MNIDWALKELDNFTFLTERVPHPSPNVIGSFPRGSKADIASQAQIAEKSWIGLRQAGALAWLASNRALDRHYEAAVRARAQLQRAEEIAQNLGKCS